MLVSFSFLYFLYWKSVTRKRDSCFSSNHWLSAGSFELKPLRGHRDGARQLVGGCFLQSHAVGAPEALRKSLLPCNPLRQICWEEGFARGCTLFPCLLVSFWSSAGVACYSFSTDWSSPTYTILDADMPPQMASSTLWISVAYMEVL